MTDIQARYLGEYQDARPRQTVPERIAELKERLGPIKPRVGGGGKFMSEAQSMARAREMSAEWAAEHGIQPTEEAQA